jgi:ribosomal protein L11 methyltransferase
VTVPASREDLATALLWELGTAGIEVRGANDDRVVLLSYFPAEPGLEAALRDALTAIPEVVLEPAEVPEVDWAARFREEFRSFEVGGFLVSPPWEQSAAAGRLVLRIDPGRAFGTGTHETTRLCLHALDRCRPSGPIFDLGTGSGILAVAACLLGLGPVIAVDLDADAVASARHHAALNGVSFAIVRADGGRAFRPASAGCVVANLTTGLLRERRTEIGDLARPGSTLILAGFLREDLPPLREAYATLGAAEVDTDGEWAALVVRRDAP